MATPQFPKGTKMAATKIFKVQILVGYRPLSWLWSSLLHSRQREAPCDVYNLLSPLLTGRKLAGMKAGLCVYQIPTQYPFPLFIEIHQGRSYSCVFTKPVNGRAYNVRHTHNYS